MLWIEIVVNTVRHHDELILLLAHHGVELKVSEIRLFTGPNSSSWVGDALAIYSIFLCDVDDLVAGVVKVEDLAITHGGKHKDPFTLLCVRRGRRWRGRRR